MLRTDNNSDGFTLLEVMISVGIFALIAGGVLIALTGGRRIFDINNVQVEVGQEVRRAIVYMTRELRQTASNKITNLTQGGAAVSSVTFQIPKSVDAGGNITWDQPIQYSLGGLNGRQILRTQGAQTSVLANNVIVLSFGWPAGSDVLNISVSAEKFAFIGFSQAGDSKVTLTLTGQAKLRN